MSSDIRSELRQEIIELAQGMVTGEVPLIHGSRQLCYLRHKIGATDNELFNPVIGFESDTDDYPIGTQRQAYSQEYLATMDAEIASYLDSSRPVIIHACVQIIAWLRSDGGVSVKAGQDKKDL